MQLSSRTIATIIILSLVAGGIGGAIGGMFIPLVAFDSPGTVQRVFESNEEATVSLVKKAAPAVVSINVSQVVAVQQPSIQQFDIFGNVFSFPGNTQQRRLRVASGSGFFVTADGMLVTNRHVVGDGKAELAIETSDGKKYSGKVIALDPTIDLAIVKVDGKDFPHLELGDSDEVQIGQTVIAIGNALSEFQNTVTKGIVSGVHRRVVAGDLQQGTEVIEEAIQTDAAINPGNSGGPLLDLSGRVIGVNTAVSESAQSLGFALPVNAVKHAIDSVNKHGRILRAWLGVRYLQVDEEFAKRNGLPHPYGALILRGDQRTDLAVIPGSPADKAGIVENDVILEMNRQKLDTDHTLSSVISRYSPGDKLVLKVLHQGKEKELTVTLEERK